MIIKVVGQDPSMNNWALVAATIDLSNECAITITDMFVSQNERKKDKSARKVVRRNSLDIERAADLSKDINAFLDKHKPNFTMVEVPHGAQSAGAMKSYGMCIALLGAMKGRCSMIQLTEGECKLHTVGKRKATKAEAIEWAMTRFPDAPWKMRTLKGEKVSVDSYNEHLADACAAIETGMYTDQFIAAVEMIQSMTAQKAG